MSFFQTSFLSLNLKLKKYSKVIVAMGGKTISDIEYDKLNRLLQTNKCALLVCNAFCSLLICLILKAYNNLMYGKNPLYNAD